MSEKPHNARARMIHLMHAVGPPPSMGGKAMTRREHDAVMVLTERIVGDIPIRPPVRPSLHLVGASVKFSGKYVVADAVREAVYPRGS